MKNLDKTSKIFVAGHNGLVGRAIVKSLKARGYETIVVRSRDGLDLLDSSAVGEFLISEKPHLVILAAAKVGGILANNKYRADFSYQNLQIQNNVIWGSHLAGVPNLVFLGSSCIYPRDAEQPIAEKALLSGPLEETNRPYAIAKIAGLELVNAIRRQYGRNYYSVMPSNLFGPGDNFNPETSHVLPALIRRFIEAGESNSSMVTIWGSGNPRREFLFSEECSAAIVYLIENLDDDFFEINSTSLAGQSHINVGSGVDISIRELAELIASEVNFKGLVAYDSSKPDGTLKKLMDSSLLSGLGWRPKRALVDGIRETIQWYRAQRNIL